jgi:ATP-dependent DNA helicase DinG
MMHIPADKIFISPACNYIREEIEKNEQGEVFFIGKPNDKQKIEEIEAKSWGNEECTVAICDIPSGYVVIHNHPSGMLTPSNQDLDVAVYLSQTGIGFYIIDNSCSYVHIVTKPAKKEEKINIEQVKDYFRRDGLLSKKLENFEFRKEQIKMAEHVAKTLNEGENLVVEAGTGTGKSFAYLLPAILWAKKNKERVVVSTNTINLQYQLINKDIPFLSKNLNIPFTASLAVGRGHFLCLRKFEEMLKTGRFLLFEGKKKEIDNLRDWATKTDEGRYEEISDCINEKLWEEICSQTDTCLYKRCKYFPDQCFYFKAKVCIATSDIIVANHHLIFSDLAISQVCKTAAFLPPYKNIIFDEAHNIENVATKHFGESLSIEGIKKTLSRLFSHSKNKNRGIVVILKTFTENLPSLNEKLDNLSKEIEEKKKQIDELSKNITDIIKTFLPQNAKEISFNENIYQLVKEPLKELYKILKEIISHGEKIEKELKQINNEKTLFYIKHFHAYIERIFSFVSLLKAFEEPQQNDILWFSIQKRSLYFHITPLKLASHMQDILFNPKRCCIFTSATLSVGNSFDFFKRNIGLKKSENLILPSSFDFKKLAKLIIVNNIKLPQEESFSENIKQAICNITKTVDGGTLILFTSIKLMNSVYELCKENLIKNHEIFKQGDMDRAKLLTLFKKSNKGILFGVSSFWEGIDVKGKALSCVVITKLPFEVPTHPVESAKYRLIEQEGGNPFIQYSLPKAVIKMKQGFGRLIRSKKDKGTIVILDKRILTKFYGKYFLDALPSCQTHISNIEQLSEIIRKD